MKKPIIIFYHVFCFSHQYNNWEDTVSEQLMKLKNSNLYDNCDSFFIRIIGSNEDIQKFYELSLNMNKIQIIKADQINDKEESTLRFLKEYSINNKNINFNILYMHTKGVHSGYNRRQKYSIKVNDWRHLMEYFIIEKWRDCIEKIENGYDACGILWRKEPLFGKIIGHFSGNFWWANSSYINKLPEIKNKSHRGYHEFWIGQGNPNVYCFYETNLNHYRSYYPPKFYVSN